MLDAAQPKTGTVINRTEDENGMKHADRRRMLANMRAIAQAAQPAGAWHANAWVERRGILRSVHASSRGHEAEHGEEQEHAGKAVEQRQPLFVKTMPTAGNRLERELRRYSGWASQAGGRRPRG